MRGLQALQSGPGARALGRQTWQAEAGNARGVWNRFPVSVLQWGAEEGERYPPITWAGRYSWLCAMSKKTRRTRSEASGASRAKGQNRS